MLRAPLLFAFSGLVAVCTAAPRLLIVQLDGPASVGARIDVTYAISQSLGERGRVEPIVWSITDEKFREAVMDGRILNAPENPSDDLVKSAAESLDCAYILRFTAGRKGASVSASGRLFEKDKELWKDERAMSADRETSQDLDNVVRSIGRTWAMLLDGGPFNKLPVRPNKPTPDMAPGRSPTVDSPPVAPKTDDTDKLLEAAAKLFVAKQAGEGLLLLRDGVDTAPFDPRRRIALIEALLANGRPSLAATEARRAATLLPDSAEIRGLAAKAWIRAGNSDQARADLNEAVARDPSNVAARALLAEIALAEGKPGAAIDHLTAAIAKSASRGLFLLRATAHAIAGHPAETDADLKSSIDPSFGGEPSLDTQMAAVGALDEAFDFSVNELRSLMQRALVRRQEEGVSIATTELTALVAARLRFAQGWIAPDALKASHGKRLLALSLLAQSLGGLKAFLGDGSEDTLTDARIDLGEAIRQQKEARKATETVGASITKDGRQPHTNHMRSVADARSRLRAPSAGLLQANRSHSIG